VFDIMVRRLGWLLIVIVCFVAGCRTQGATRLPDQATAVDDT
jgi:hypothetical protein